MSYVIRTNDRTPPLFWTGSGWAPGFPEIFASERQARKTWWRLRTENRGIVVAKLGAT